MNTKGPQAHLRQLGKRLKELRDKARESLAEASSAVEIDAKTLADYELGFDRPSEDVLLLLLSHFGAQDDEALSMWELAGYNISKVPMARMSSSEVIQEKTDDTANIYFTDVVDVTVNSYGVVLNFLQNSGSAGKMKSISRVGMSRDHAKNVIKILQTTLAKTEPDPKANIQNKLK